MKNLMTFTDRKNSKNWTRFTFTEGSQTVVQASSTGLMVEIDRATAATMIGNLQNQARWKLTCKVLKG